MPWMDAGNRMIWQALKLYLRGTRLTSVQRSPHQQLAFIVWTARQKGYTATRSPILGNRSTWVGALDYIRAKGYKSPNQAEAFTNAAWRTSVPSESQRHQEGIAEGCC